jgi:hypothetical protein
LEFTSGRHLDLGSGFALWVSKMIEDEMQQFSKEGCVFPGVSVLDDNLLSELERVKRAVEAA